MTLLDERPAGSNGGPPGDARATIPAVGGPVSSAWREDALTRANELEALCEWVLRQCPDRRGTDEPLQEGVAQHLLAARQGAMAPLHSRLHRGGSELQRAMGNLYAAEAQLLDIAPASYLLGQLPSVLNHVQRHLSATDARRKEVERIAQAVGVKDLDHPLGQGTPLPREQREAVVDAERGTIATAARGASTAALREQLQVRSFRNVLIFAALVMSVLAVGLAVWSYSNPTVIPLCFQPETPGQTVVVCPTGESREADPGARAGTPVDIDTIVAGTAGAQDTMVVELVGLIAAAIAAAAAIRGIRGSSESLHLPVALALLKLPTGAVTAYLGLVLMRGQFIPGLSALDTSAQIIAWAAVFGYAQQLFTRLVDQQAHSVLDSVRAADKPAGALAPA